MEQDIKKKLVIPFIIFLGFIALSVSSVYRGIVNHETWRIVLASVGGAFFVGFVVLIILKVFRAGNEAA